MFYIDTLELQEHIINLFMQLKPLAKKDGTYHDIGIFFSEGTPQNIEGSYCYSGDHGYHYCHTERGAVWQDNVTNSLFEITYWVLKDQVFLMAMDYASQHEIKGQDTRRIAFQKELEYFDVWGGNLKKRAEIDIDELLKIAPYQDHLFS